MGFAFGNTERCRLAVVAFAACAVAGGACGAAGTADTSTGGVSGTGGTSVGTGGSMAGTGSGAGSGGNGNGTGGTLVGTGGDGAGTGGARTGTGGGSTGTAGGGAAGASVTGSGGAAGTGARGMGGSSGGTAGGAGPGVVSLFDGTTLNGWLPSSGTGVGNAPASWNVLDNALHCTGIVRGTLISKSDYGNFRLIFNVRQLPSTGADNHYASVLIWGARPPPNDAIGGIQFGNPNGYFWDYRPGHNNSGAAFFVSTSGGYSRTAWAQCEILTNIATGVARMACCSLGTATSCKATEVLTFTDPSAGRTGPIALQAHSVGGHDEYKNITIEENPTVNDLITTK